jgi:hypothetical protein
MGYMEETLRFCKKAFEMHMNYKKKKMLVYQYISRNIDINK